MTVTDLKDWGHFEHAKDDFHYLISTDHNGLQVFSIWDYLIFRIQFIEEF